MFHYKPYMLGYPTHSKHGAQKRAPGWTWRWHPPPPAMPRMQHQRRRSGWKCKHIMIIKYTLYIFDAWYLRSSTVCAYIYAVYIYAYNSMFIQYMVYVCLFVAWSKVLLHHLQNTPSGPVDRSGWWAICRSAYLSSVSVCLCVSASHHINFSHAHVRGGFVQQRHALA